MLSRQSEKEKKRPQERKGFAGHFCVVGSHVFLFFNFSVMFVLIIKKT